MLSELLLFILWTNTIDWKGKTIFYLLFIEMKVYGPRQGPQPLHWAKRHIFLEALFISNNINTNLNKNFHT